MIRILVLVGLMALMPFVASAATELDEVEVSRHTGQVGTTATAATTTVSESDGPTVFCASRHTRALSWRDGICPGGMTALPTTWNGEINACERRSTGALRWTPTGSCAPNERDVTI